MNNEQRFLDNDGRVKQWPSKHADKLLVLAYLATKFDLAEIYSEADVNGVLKQWHTFGDWSMLRRDLCDYGFLERNTDGSDYKLARIETSFPGLILVRPNIAQDPLISVEWINGPDGHETMRLMGNTDEGNKPTTLELEEKRVREFITSTGSRTWAMNLDGRTIGSIWLTTVPTNYLKDPSVHFMIGDTGSRKRGIGRATLSAVIELLENEAVHDELYSRYMVGNEGSAHLLSKVGFEIDGEVYRDEDGLYFQNVKRKLDIKHV